MRTLLAVGAVLMAAGCAVQPQTPPVVSWQYGAGDGDAVSPRGPAPVYSQTYDLSDGEPVTPSGQAPAPSLAYGADGQTGTMVQMTPQAPQTPVAPTPVPQPQRAAPGPRL